MDSLDKLPFISGGKMTEWIKVSEDRPKVGDEFLIYVDPELVMNHVERGWSCHSPMGITISNNIPLLCFHWMPLPNPPEEL